MNRNRKPSRAEDAYQDWLMNKPSGSRPSINHAFFAGWEAHLSRGTNGPFVVRNLKSEIRSNCESEITRQVIELDALFAIIDKQLEKESGE